MRHHQLDHAAGAGDAVDLGDERQQLLHVLERVRAEHLLGAVVGQEIERLVQVGDDVHPFELEPVQRIESGAGARPGADVEPQTLALLEIPRDLGVEKSHLVCPETAY
jgi:hypothetical protein